MASLCNFGVSYGRRTRFGSMGYFDGVFSGLL